MKIGRITVVDSLGSGPNAAKMELEIEEKIARIFEEPTEFIRVHVGSAAELQKALVRLCEQACPLIFTTGGTGPGLKDFVPDVTREFIERELPGFGETIRHYSFRRTPVALLSRAVAGVHGTSLIMNLPSRPKAIFGCLKLLREAIVECLHQLTGVHHPLWVDEIEIPMEKWFPFLRRFRVKPGPNGE